MSIHLSKPSRFLGPLPFYKRALTIALPVMAQLLIQNLVSLIDNFMVAGLGDVKMSGVNIAGQISFVFLVLTNTLCSSGGIFMSQYNGAKDSGGMQQTFRFKMIVCIAAGVIYTLFAGINPSPVLGLMVRGNSSSDAIVAEATRYMRVLSLCGIPLVISNVISSSLREIGEVKKPLIFSVIATLVNTFLNWVLIYGNLGAPRLEVVGAAIATILARLVEMTLFIIYIKRVHPPFYSRIRDMFKVSLKLFGTILKKSAMILISEMCWVISETITTALYNGRGGADVVSGMSAGFAIANLFFISFNGIFTATGVVMGGTLGADKISEARSQKNWLLNGSFIFGIFFGLLGCASTLLIPLVFGNLSEASRMTARGLILVMAAYMPLWCYVNAQLAVSRTGGDTIMGVIMDMVTNLCFVLPGMFFMAYKTALSPVKMYTLIKLTDVLKILIAHFWLKKERWLRNLAGENAVSAPSIQAIPKSDSVVAVSDLAGKESDKPE